jgi:hypothetical protein
MNKIRVWRRAAITALAVFVPLVAAPTESLAAAADAAALAQKTLNPIADLVSLPFQLNYDDGLGADDDGSKWLLNIQPVVPISINGDWNMISRTIVPLIDQQDIVPGGAADASGLGDIVESLFFSPKQPTAGGWVWGVGPVFLLPTAGDDLLGAGKWGLGPTFVGLKQDKGWTYGVLANHIWSVAGEDDRSDVNATFLQPFLSYTMKTYTSLSVNTESTYDWEGEQWSVPLNLMVSQLLKVGNRPLSLVAGVRYWADSPEGGPEGWGYRLALTFLFPK